MASTVDIVKSNVAQIEQLLAQSQDKIASSLPLHMKAEKMISVAMELVSGDSKLCLCEPLSIVKGVVEASQLGLSLNKHLGHAYLVPFKNGELTNKYKVQMYTAEFLIGYRGLVDMVRRSNSAVTSIYGRIVYTGEHFELLEGTQHQLVHVPSLSARDIKDYTGVYAVVLFKDGTQPDFEYMPKEEVEKVHKFSKAQGPDSPWSTWRSEMMKKTALRRLCKRLKLSPDIIEATVRDEYRDLGYEGEKPQARTIIMPRRMSDPLPPEPPQEQRSQEESPEPPQQETQPEPSQPTSNGNGELAAPVSEFIGLVTVIVKVDNTITAQAIVDRYFKSKSGKIPKYEELRTWHSEKQLTWVSGVCEKIRKDYSTIFPPDPNHDPEPPEEGPEEPPIEEASAPEPSPAPSQPTAKKGNIEFIDATAIGKVWHMAHTYLWAKGEGAPDDPLHTWLNRMLPGMDSVTKIPKTALEAVLNQLKKGPQSVGLPVAK
jgi:recombination protein RecT